MKILENIMQELGNDQRDEIISSIEDLLVSMHVSIEPTSKPELYDMEFFKVYYMKTRPEFLKTLTEPQIFTY
jgi:hypothetical protein